MRKPTALEFTIIQRMAKEIVPPSVQAQLLRDLESCMINCVRPDESLIRFDIEGYCRPDYKGQHSFTGKDGFPVGGVTTDEDGSKVEVWLYADENNRILEIELNKWDGAPLKRVNWENFLVN